MTAFSKFGVSFSPRTGKAKCSRCGGQLTLSRSCLTAFLRCPSCGTRFELADFVKDMDEDFDEAYANIPMDRL